VAEHFPSIENRPSLTQLKSRSSDATFGLKISIYVLSIYYGATWALSSSWLLQTTGIILLGLIFAHGVELQHQALHNQGIQNRLINETVGIFLGLPMLVSYAGYQASHLRHHKHLGTPENKEFFDYGDQYGQKKASLILWAYRLWMPTLYVSFVKNIWITIWSRNFRNESADVSRRMCRDYLLMLLCVSALSVFSYATYSLVILKIWIFPLLLVAAPVHALIELPEHFACDTQSKNVFDNTRTIRSNAFLTWFTNGNNYHVEHHMMPGLPIDRLHDLHASISGQISHYYPTYRAFYRALFSNSLSAKSGRHSV